jgi:type I restriction enzyme R subunit
LFSVDAVASLTKLRLLGERLAKELAAHAGLALGDSSQQSQLLRDLRARSLLHPEVADIFHGLRIAGNRAVHEGVGTPGEALHQLKMTRRLGVAVLTTLGKLPPGFKLGPFIPPAAPVDATAELREEIEVLRREAGKASAAHAEALEAAEFERELREDYERQLSLLKTKLAETEAAFDELAASRDEQVAAMQAFVAAQPAQEQQKSLDVLTNNARTAGQRLDLTEAETRGLVDHQLREAGWEADSTLLRYSRGARLVKGRSLAIAEWPTESGPPFSVGIPRKDYRSSSRRITRRHMTSSTRIRSRRSVSGPTRRRQSGPSSTQSRTGGGRR